MVDVAMYDSVLSLTERIVYQHSITGQSPIPQGNTHPLLCPYGVVRTADGFLTVATPSDHHWRLLTEILGRPELGTEPRFATNAARLECSDEVYGALEEWSRQRSTADVVSALGGRIPCGPVSTAADIAADPHVAARDMIVQVDHPVGRPIGIAGTPIKLTRTPATRLVRAPLVGEHTAEVLEELARRRADDVPGRGTPAPTGPGGDRP
jgi:crotonobetainyl-CoA:carnitine CoA-transferase CaiB-like acyl-CoA transferase